MRRLDKPTALAVASQILGHLAARAEPAATYQFLIPGDVFLTVSSSEHGGRRMLTFYSHRGVHIARLIVAIINWPKKYEQTKAWFAWPMTDRERRRHVKRISYCIQSVRYNNDTEPVDGAIVIDPATAPGL